MEFDEEEPNEQEPMELSLLMEAVMPKLVNCRLREYQPEDREACLEIHRSNLPHLQGTQSEEAFEEFLELGTSYFLVAEEHGDIIACAGLELVGDTDTATLVHAMVHADFHRRGFGTTLFAACLALLEPEGRPVELQARASRQAASFFGRFGFRLHSVSKNSDRGLLWLSVQEDDVADVRDALEERGIRIELNDPEEEGTLEDDDES